MSAKAGQAVYLTKSDSFSFPYQWINWLISFVIGCAVLIWLGNHLNNPQTLPVNKIRVHGTFINVNEAMLHKAVDGVVAGGYFNVDVERVREVIELLPWVSKASVRRVWPDTISVNVIEQKAVAISGKSELINADGGVFQKSIKHVPANLPVLDGPENLNKLMLSKYYEMSNQLMAINKKIVYLKFDARHAVELKLGDNLKIILGRDDVLQRLDRLIRIYPKVLAAHSGNINIIDLRYTNGMAIRWKNNTKKQKGISGDMNHV